MTRDATFNTIAVAAGAVAQVVVGMLLARSFPPADVGMYSLVLWVAALAVGLATAGLPGAVSRYVAEVIGHPGLAVQLLRRVFRRLLPLASVGALAAAGLVAVATRHWVFAVCAGLAVVPTSVAAVLLAAFRGQRRFRDVAVRQCLVAALGVTLVFAAVRAGLGTAGLGITIALVPLINALLYLSALRSRSTRVLPEELWGRLRRVSRSLAILGVIDLIVWQRSEILVLRIFHHAQEIALYSLPFALAGALMLVPASISGILLPRLVTSRHDPAQRVIIYGQAVRFLAAIALPIAAAGLFFAEPLMRVVFGPAYVEGTQAFAVLLAAGAVTAIFSPGSSVLIAEEAVGFMVRWGMAAAALNVLLDFLLIPPLGAAGAAAASASAQLFAIGVTLVHLIRTRLVVVPWESLAKLFAAALAAAGIARAVAQAGPVAEPFTLPFAAVVGVAAYAVLLVVVGAWRDLASGLGVGRLAKEARFEMTRPDLRNPEVP